MEVAAIIPARYGSTRLEGKPLLEIGGKPMVRWVYERALEARTVGDVTVATDDERIFRAVREFGGRVVMTSPDHASGTDRVAEAAGAGGEGGGGHDVVVNLQADEPLIEPGMIDAAVNPMLEDDSLVLATLKTRITDPSEIEDPNVVKVVTDSEGYALYFSRIAIPYSKEPPGEVFKHIGLYVYRRDFLMKFAALPRTPLERSEGLEQLRALENGFKIKVVETPFNPVSVDTPEDLEEVRRIMAG
ncbi:MAG: 3-deoxy-manno-octulosonate cytidylyltransferase [Thermodesulfobacteriota bacterium]